MRRVSLLASSVLFLLTPACEKPTADDLFKAIKLQRPDRVESIGKKNKAALEAKNADGFSPLTASVSLGNRGLVEALLKAGAQPNARDDRTRSPLDLAIAADSAPIATLLVEAGADLKAADEKRQTPLFTAAAKGSDNIVRLFLKHGADLNALDKEGESALHSAIRSKNLNVVDTLVQAGASLTIRDRAGRKPVELAGDEGSVEMFGYFQAKGQVAIYDGEIHDAVERGKGNIVQSLLSKNAALANAEGGRGNRPLHFTCVKDRIDLASFLVKKGADVRAANGIGNTPLHECSALGSSKVAQFMVNQKADVNAKNRKGETPLHLAAREGKEEIVSFLLQSGADAKTPDADGETALLEAVRSSHPRTVALLLSSGTVDVKDSTGRTALSYAQDPKIVEALLDKGASPNVIDSKGCSPLERAVFVGCRKCMELLLEKGGKEPAAAAPSNHGAKDCLGQTPLHYAALMGKTDAAKLLLSKGADVSQVADLSPIHKAAMGGSKEVIELLLGHGANINAQTISTDATPIHLAAKMGEAGAVAFLIEKGARLNLVTQKDETALHLAVDGSLSPEVVKHLIAAKIDRGAENNSGETALDIAQWREAHETDKEIVQKAKEVARLILKGP